MITTRKLSSSRANKIRAIKSINFQPFKMASSENEKMQQKVQAYQNQQKATI